jgi:hypothetical protein
MYAIFKLFWVRKLIGKPALLTIADCESEARRIQFDYGIGLSLPATESNAFRIHSPRPSGEAAMAACITLFSSLETRAWMMISRSLAFGTFGLPIFGFIKYFVYDENNC